MPIPTFTGLRPKPQFEDVVQKLNELADELTNLMLNLDDANFDSITANVIDVQELSAISANLGHITAGLIESVTITGALIQTSTSSYPRAELRSDSQLFKAAQTANERIEVVASYSSGTPAVLFYQGGQIKATMQEVGGSDFLIATLLGDQLNFSANDHINLTSTSGGNINLSASGAVNLTPTGALTINGITGFTGTFSTGTQTVTVTKGIITSVV